MSCLSILTVYVYLHKLYHHKIKARLSRSEMKELQEGEDLLMFLSVNPVVLAADVDPAL